MRILYWGLFLCLAAVAQAAQATVIRFQTVNLLDTVAGQDLWQYQYDVSGLPADALGFDVYFKLNDGYRWGDLSNATSPDGDWSTIAVQVDPAIPADGFFDAAMAVSSPGLPTFPGSYFSIDFIWRGSGLPGIQDFTVYDSSYAVIGSGRTVPYSQQRRGLPEPGVSSLLLAGLLAMRTARRRAAAPAKTRFRL